MSFTNDLVKEERQAAIRALLRKPIILRDENPETFGLIRKNQSTLTNWFGSALGWRLTVDQAAGFVRLFKMPADKAAQRLVYIKPGEPFKKRHYVLLSLTLAVLSGLDPQTTIKNLDESLREMSLPEGIVRYDPRDANERHVLIQVLRWLTELGVLKLRDGTEEAYARSREGDGLYDVNNRLVAHMLGGELGPSMLEGPQGLGRETYPDTEDGRNERLRHRVTRRLMDEAVLYFEDLSAEERIWLESKRGYLYDLAGDVGFEVERRAEGLAAIDPGGMTTDETFPSAVFSTKRHAAIFLLEQLISGSVKDLGMTQEDVEHFTARTIEDQAEICNWSGVYRRDAEGGKRLAREAMGLLERFGLVKFDGKRWLARPAMARYRLGSTSEEADESAEAE